MDEPKMYRDASDRLSFSTSDLSMIDYPAVCAQAARTFELIPHGELVTDMVSVIFREYRREKHAVELVWDNWMGFAITAMTPESERLVQQIANWLIAKQRGLP